MAQIKWRKSYGDGEYTEDYVLWLNNEPTDYVISPSTYGGWWLMVGRNDIGCFDTLKTSKEEFILYLKEQGVL
jgi:hypothetical protein